MPIRKPTALEIKAYREKHQCGIGEARAACWKVWRAAVRDVLRIQAQLVHPQSRGFANTLVDYLEALEDANYGRKE